MSNRFSTLLQRVSRRPETSIRRLECRQDLIILLFATGFLFLFLEVVLFSGVRFVTSYFRAQLVIATGLLGLTGGGVLAAIISEQKLERYLKIGVSFLALAPLVGGTAAILGQISFGLSVLLLGISFLPVGFLISVLYRLVEPRLAYVVELVGGGSGLVAALFFIPYIREENSLLLASFLGAVLAVIIVYPVIRWPWKGLFIFLFCFSLLLFLSNLQYDYLNLANITPCNPSPPDKLDRIKIFCHRYQPQYKVVRSLGSVVDRIDIFYLGSGMLHTAFSGSGSDQITPYPPPYYEFDARLPNITSLLPNPKTLIIGSAAEGVVKVVKAIGGHDITALDINPAIINLWKTDEEIRDYAQNPFQDTTLNLADGRTFLEKTGENFDLITLLNTHRARDLAAFGDPDFLHTSEAFQLYWQHLTKNGILAIEEKNLNSAAEKSIQNIAYTLQGALRATGVDNPPDHIVVSEWTLVVKVRSKTGESRKESVQLVTAPINFVQFWVKKSPWTVQEIQELKGWAKDSQPTVDNMVIPFRLAVQRWLWTPQIHEPPGQSNYIAAIYAAESAGENYTRYRLLTDNYPFPVVSLAFDNQELYFALVVFIILVGAAWMLWYRQTTIRQRERQWLFPLYFMAIGLGYMFIEIALMQWLQRYLGSVLPSLAIAIGGLLLASAVGGWLGKRKVVFHDLMLLALPSIVLIYLLFFSYPGLPLLSFKSLFARSLIGLTLTFPIGFGLGVFFPSGMELVNRHFKQEGPILVGLNGSAMAAAVPLAFFITSAWGITSLIALAYLLYVGSLFLLNFLDRNVLEPQSC